jgi:transposase-like protein
VSVLEVRSGVAVTEVAVRFGVSRHSAHAWVRRYGQYALGAQAASAYCPSEPGAPERRARWGQALAV